jgi:pimeloyl-ACP methyl ester carboxylesterase
MIDQTIEIEGKNQNRKIAYCESGNSKSENIIFCIPGILETKDTFLPLHKYLLGADNVHIISIDLCGRGASSPLGNDENYLMSVYLADVKFLITKILNKKQRLNSKLINIYLIGTSMGGLLTFYLLQEFGDQIKGICLNDIGLTLKWISIFELSKPIRNSNISLQDLARVLNVDSKVLIEVQKNEHFDLSYKSDFIGMHFSQLLDHFKGILFLVHGEKSVVCTSDVVLEFKLRFPRASYMEINESLHPVTLNEMIAGEILSKFKLIN